MSKKELAIISDIWFVACLTYLGYELAYITKIGDRKFEYAIQCASLDLEDLQKSYYEKGDLALADAKAFVNSFNILVANQKTAQRNGQWTSSNWINGVIG